MILFGYLSSIIYGALVLLLSALAYRLGLPKPYCRKLVHVLIGGEYIVLSYFFGTSLHFLLVALIFTALLFFNYTRRLLPMISSDADNDLGTVYFGISMSALALAVFLSSPVALPIGQTWWHIQQKRQLSICCFDFSVNCISFSSY